MTEPRPAPDADTPPEPGAADGSSEVTESADESDAAASAEAPASAEAVHGWGTRSAPAARVASEPLPPLPVEGSLRAAMDDVGTGWWPLLLVGAVGFVPLWALIVALGDHPASSMVQFLALIPTSALLAAAGAVRFDRRATLTGSYRHALVRLLHYFLANLVVGIVVLLIVLVPVLVAVVAGVTLAVGGASEPGPFVAIGVVAALVALVPLIIVSTRLGLVGPIVVVERLGVGEALTETWRRTRGQVLRLLVVFFVGSIPAVLVGMGAALVGFGLLGQPVLAGAALGLGYAIGIAVFSCLNIVAWQRLGGAAPAEPETDAAPKPRTRDRGPLTAVLLLAGGLLLMTVGSMAAVGKVGGWLEALSGQEGGVITYGVGGVGCLQLDERLVFEAGEPVHAVAVLSSAVPGGERLEYEILVDSQLVDRGFEDPFTDETTCVYFDLDTTDIEPAVYTFRYLWGADVLATGSFRITE